MVQTGILLGYGNPLLDISVQASKDYLDKYDLKADNAILAEDKHKPMYKEMADTFPDVEYIPGGATLNSIRVAQWLLKTPKATSFFGCIARDEFGDILTKAANAAGVDVKFQYTKKEPTGTCAVVCTDKNRSLVANLAAANCFTEEHLDDPSNWAAVETSKFIYFGGYPLTVCPDAMVRIAKYAAEQNKVVLMNTSAPFLCTFFKDAMLRMLPYADYFFGNESEADEFAKANDLGTTDRKEIAMKMANWEKVNSSRSRTVVITQGADPALVVADGQLKEYPVIPIKESEIVDSNGAGDAFVGGFLAQLVQGQSLDECMKSGHRVANIILQRPGCTFPEQPPSS
ncbi:adenosine kinase 1 isoform X2 [Aplysia californica]|uniref:Adenosine kinase n=1 Tax=Aplysia californica TaxID=6500 RepID=A0ABM0KA07_APLCA|nr:adenosine kinase 1 isoform X2 [Aplysia californica]